MIRLSQLEARVIGVLLEKEATTPDQYPLTLNSLTTGCNQKTNREPVMELEETEVQDAVDMLQKSGLVMESRVGSRVSKYKHRFCNTEFSELKLNDEERSIVCVLLLRGPQTPGELRTRCARIHDFNDVSQVESALSKLSQNAPPLVECMTREAGKRESRYRQLFSDFDTTTTDIADQTAPREDRVALLEQRLQKVEESLKHIESQLADLL